MLRKILFITLIISGISLTTYAQTIKGTVFERTEKGELPLTGVNIYWKGTTKGTTSDSDGKFSIQSKGIRQKTLIASFIGYKTDTVDIASLPEELKIVLAPADLVLHEVEIKDRTGTYISKLNARQTQVINIAELQRAACCNLAESFETNASVDVSYSDAVSGAKQIQLLGLSGLYSQVMTENIPLIRGLSSIYGLNYIPGPWMESIQVSKGTASVINGYESVTGQINVEYKKPEKSEKIYANLYLNSNLRAEANANGSVRFNDKLSTMILGHVDRFSNVFDRNDDGFMDLPRLTTYNIFNRWDYMVPGKIHSKFGIQYLDESREGGQMDFNDENYSFDTNGISNGTKIYGADIRTKRLAAFWKNGFFFKNHPKASVGFIMSGIIHDQQGYYGINKYNANEKSGYANLIFSTTTKDDKHKFVTGASYVIDDYVENFLQTKMIYDFSSDNIFKLRDTTMHYFDMDRTEWSTGAFFEYTLNLEKLTVIAGIRGDYNNLWGYFATPRLHIRYKITPKTIIRGSAGMGYRTANVFAENSPQFMSQRVFVFDEKLEQERAWNFGMNLSHEFGMFGRKAEVDLDLYRTQFINQVIVDDDRNPTEVHFYNLDGKSYSNSVQVQLMAEPLKRLKVTMAFRVNDVKQTIDGELQEKPFSNLYKGLVTLGYSTKGDKWLFDLTGQLNGPARIPNADNMPPILTRPGHSPVFFQLLGQITRKFKYFDVYLGGENLTNYTQKDPIVEWFLPYHSHFDAAMVWGPITGITVYGGLRFKLDYK